MHELSILIVPFSIWKKRYLSLNIFSLYLFFRFYTPLYFFSHYGRVVIGKLWYRAVIIIYLIYLTAIIPLS